MNKFEIFNNNNLGSIRAVFPNGKDDPWFVLVDVCKILEIQNVSQAAQQIYEDDRAMFNIGRSSKHGGGGEAIIINESGLYTIIMRSNKPNALQFQRWVTSEVLPSIRKTGKYVMSELEWTVYRQLTKFIHVAQESAIREMSRPLSLHRHQQKAMFSDEADLLNLVVFGMTANEWRILYPDKKGNMRDHASTKELFLLQLVETINMAWILVNIPLSERFNMLSQMINTFVRSVQYKEGTLIPNKDNYPDIPFFMLGDVGDPEDTLRESE